MAQFRANYSKLALKLLRKLPEREVTAGGHAAIVTSFESVTEQARLDVVSARDTYRVLSIHGISGA